MEYSLTKVFFRSSPSFPVSTLFLAQFFPLINLMGHAIHYFSGFCFKVLAIIAYRLYNNLTIKPFAGVTPCK